MEVYEEYYTISENLNSDFTICTPWSKESRETILHPLFLEAYELTLCDSFYCKVDEQGGILVDTIQKVKSD